MDGELEPWIRCCTARFLPVARRIAREDDLAHDALQESWIIVLDKLYQYHGSAPACGWVASIVRHEVLRAVKARSREVPLGQAEEPVNPSGPETDALRDELRRLLLQAIDDLPPTFQEIVKLRDVEDCSNVEVARRLHISPQNAAVRLHRAHRLLRERLMPLR